MMPDKISRSFLKVQRAAPSKMKPGNKSELPTSLLPNAPSKKMINRRVKIRLSKRMSELEFCSRREADALINSGSVLLQGQVAILGQKVSARETDIKIVRSDAPEGTSSSSIVSDPINDPTSTILLHKPRGYVSGQPEDGHTPAVRLLTRNNYRFGNASLLQDFQFRGFNRTLDGYAPAGRLDMNSSGLLLFTKSGLMAKKLVQANGEGGVEKEYFVRVVPASSMSRSKDIVARVPVIDLSVLLKGGATLERDSRPLLPLPVAEWVKSTPTPFLSREASSPGGAEERILRLVLREGKKRQIRRMCRQLLGWEVVDLHRVRIGKIELDDSLPMGSWRPLRKDEVLSILGDTRTQ